MSSVKWLLPASDSLDIISFTLPSSLAASLCVLNQQFASSQSSSRPLLPHLCTKHCFLYTQVGPSAWDSPAPVLEAQCDLGTAGTWKAVTWSGLRAYWTIWPLWPVLIKLPLGPAPGCCPALGLTQWVHRNSRDINRYAACGLWEFVSLENNRFSPQLPPK